MVITAIFAAPVLTQRLLIFHSEYSFAMQKYCIFMYLLFFTHIVLILAHWSKTVYFQHICHIVYIYNIQCLFIPIQKSFFWKYIENSTSGQTRNIVTTYIMCVRNISKKMLQCKWTACTRSELFVFFGQILENLPSFFNKYKGIPKEIFSTSFRNDQICTVGPICTVGGKLRSVPQPPCLYDFLHTNKSEFAILFGFGT